MTNLTRDNKITLMAISFEFATIIAKLSIRVSNEIPFNENDADNIVSNCTSLQSIMAMILEVDHEVLREAMRLTRAGREIDEILKSNGTQADA